MMSVDIFERAKKQLYGKPTCLELLNHIWPLVKDFDFSKGKNLKIPMPTHHPIVYSKFWGFYSRLGEFAPYSHRTIRRTLSTLELCPSNPMNQEFLIIEELPTKKTS